jgi:type IV secretory pathway VirB2 component (pilin)
MTQPVDQNALGGAVQWLQQALLGTVATTICVVAIASFGLAMLQGRISVRRGSSVLLGCALIVVAPIISGALMLTIEGAVGQDYIGLHDAPKIPGSPEPDTNDADPYAGAAPP